MPIPDFQSIMLPLLKFYSNGEERSTKDAINSLAEYFNLSEEELEELLPSKVQKIFYNRVHWALAYLKMASLIESNKRGYYKITSNGNKILKSNPPIINIKFLKTIPEYIEWTNTFNKEKKLSTSENDTIDDVKDESLTPEESLEISFQKINDSLAHELLDKIKQMHPTFFEKLVIDLLVKMGYGGSINDAGKAIGKSGDEGIDGIIKEDKLGLDVIYVQAKRWEGVVGRPEIQKFVGALAGQGAKKGIFITTSYFSKDALEYNPKNETKIVLIDGEKLAKFMIEYDLAVTTVSNYKLKKMDLDYFGEE